MDGKSKSLLCRLDLSLNVRSKSSYQDTQAESVISVRRDKCKDVEASEEVFRSSNKGVYGNALTSCRHWVQLDGVVWDALLELSFVPFVILCF